MKEHRASVHKELIGEKSASQKYRELFIGQSSLWSFVQYELIILLFSWMPGILTRYPSLTIRSLMTILYWMPKGMIMRGSGSAKTPISAATHVEL